MVKNKMRKDDFFFALIASVLLIMLMTGCKGESTPETQATQEMQDKDIEEQETVSSSLFQDDMEKYNPEIWHTADGWTNGIPFWVGWRSDHVEFLDGTMKLRLDNHPCVDNLSDCSEQPYASGEYRTNEFFHYGCVEGHLKAAKSNGIVTSLFVYTGPSDNNPHDEIDIEILGKETSQMQINYFADGAGGHEVVVDLGFDASEDFHTYAFDWSPTAIKWYVDGEVVHIEDGSNGALPITPSRIMMNLWAGTEVDDWLDTFEYSGSPIYASYDWIKFTPVGCEQ